MLHIINYGHCPTFGNILLAAVNFNRKMERVNRFKVNTFNRKFKEVWKYCKSFDEAYKHRQHGIDNGLASSIFEYKDGRWYHV